MEGGEWLGLGESGSEGVVKYGVEVEGEQWLELRLELSAGWS